MTPSLAALLKEIEDREKAAAPGPWERIAAPHGEGGHIRGPLGSIVWEGAPGYAIVCQQVGGANGAFIAAARTDIPRLLSALREAVEGLEEMKALLVCRSTGGRPNGLMEGGFRVCECDGCDASRIHDLTLARVERVMGEQ